MTSAPPASRGGARFRALLRLHHDPATAIGVALLPVAAYTGHVLAHSGHHPLLGGDQAVLEMWTRSAGDGEALLGPYSRYHWNHPGPLIFYWWAAHAKVFGVSPFAMSLGALNIGLLSLGVVLLTIRRVSGVGAVWCATIVVLYFFFRAGYDWIDDPWNPIVVVLPVAALGITSAAVVAGHRWALPISVTLASLAVQTHLGTGPVVAGIAISLLVGTAAGGYARYWRAWVAPVVLSVFLVALIWAPPIYEELSREPGNITQLRDFERTTEADQAMGDVLDLVTPQVSLGGTELVQSALGRGGRTLEPPGWLTYVYTIAIAAATVSLAALNWRRWRFESALSLVAFSSLVGLIWGLKSVVGPLEGYLTLTATAVGLLLHLSLVLGVRRWLTDTATSRDASALDQILPPARRMLKPFAATFGVLGFVVAAVSPHPYLYTARKDDAPRSEVQRIRSALSPGTSGVVIFIDDASAWPEAALLANQLEEDQVWVAVAPEYEFLFGDQRRVTGCENVALRVDFDLQPGDLPLGPAAATLMRRTPHRSCS